MVFQLAGQLPSNILHVLYMDNLFTRVPLLRRLREIGIGACGTTRRHPKFPTFLLDLKEHCARRMEWNITAAIVVRRKIEIKHENEESQ
jgi:Transposase IS4